ncbi:hypothetical protein VP1G_01053 [Cytospora mali]|uniref:Uncharacterized protein n=1 Tax=Cytospora mali TaxID=578113 RepID=A0A194UPF1_CYTMA|nr:hypothetical protein VP1G_01053 [Valsa mali var. pyri (nom. inval.)]
MSRPSPAPRSHSRTSCFSTTTYHSFQDIELYEPGSTPEARDTFTSRLPRPSGSKANPGAGKHRTSRKDDFEKESFAARMVRQDSGYESGTTAPASKQYKKLRHSASQYTTSSPSLRTDSKSRTSSPQTRQRPSLRRSRPISTTMPRSSLTISRSPQRPQHNDPYSYFQFPSPEQLEEQHQRQSADLAPVILHVNTANQQPQQQNSTQQNPVEPPSTKESAYATTESPLTPLPPQTTHYWTSDRTRRLEYAAIDAASRGVRGWIMRNCVPECFVPKEKRRVGFEDDSGSVRRYRLDLEIECPEDSVPPSPVGEKPRGFRARGRRSSFWAKLRGRE